VPILLDLNIWTYNGRLEIAMRKIWPFSFYFLYFAGFSSFLPFIVIYYQQLNFSGAQIGLLTGLPPLIILFAAPFWTGVADSMQRHRLVMSLGLVVAIIVGFLFPSVSNFALVFILIVVFNFFFSPVAPLSDSATMNILGEQRGMYGRIRLGGTIGWGVFAPIAGFLAQNYGLKLAFWAFSVLTLINLFVGQKLSFGNADASTGSNGGIKVLLKNRRWIYFLSAAFLSGLGVLSATTYLYPYMKELGASETQMGIASAIATLTELIVFFFGDRLVRRFTARRLFLIALVLIGIRSFLYAAVNTTYLVWVVQAFGGMVFPAMWSAGVAYADENSPVGLKSTAQGLLGAVAFGFSSAIGGFIGGLLIESIGGRGMFLVFGIIIFVGLALIEGMKRLFPEREFVQAEI